MAGHSKWANIKHKKERADAKKGKVFSRLAKEIISAVKQGGSDPKSNAKLRLVLQKAKAANLPSENIERNIKKASKSDQADFYELVYELYGHGGVGILVDVMTDNKNRIASNMRIATNKKGGSIGSSGSVAYNFERKGIIQISKKEQDEETLFLYASEAGAEDFETTEEVFLIVTKPEKLFEVKEKIEEKGEKCLSAAYEMVPKTMVSCSEKHQKANLELFEFIEGLDDVDALYHNMELYTQPGL